MLIVRNLIASSIILILLSCSCAVEFDVLAFKLYYDRFNHEAHIRNVNVDAYIMPIRFEPMPKGSHAIGTCYLFDHIGINKEFWSWASEDQREVLIFHELGHCVLFQDHTETGIMQPELYGSDTYQLERTALLDELFKTFGTWRFGGVIIDILHE